MASHIKPRTYCAGIWTDIKLDAHGIPYERLTPVFGADARLGHVHGSNGLILRVTAVLRRWRYLALSGYSYDTWQLDATNDDDRTVWHGRANGPECLAQLHRCSDMPGDHNHQDQGVYS